MTSHQKNTEKTNENVLTGIRDAYTVSATTETESSEVNKLMIKTFLETLADISLSIATRKEKGID